MTTVLLLIGVVVVVLLVPMPHLRSDQQTRNHLQEISREILDVYFENIGHGSASAIAEYLGRPLEDVQAALNLMRGRSVYWTRNAYGFPVWHRNAHL